MNKQLLAIVREYDRECQGMRLVAYTNALATLPLLEQKGIHERDAIGMSFPPELANRLLTATGHRLLTDTECQKGITVGRWRDRPATIYRVNLGG